MFPVGGAGSDDEECILGRILIAGERKLAESAVIWRSLAGRPMVVRFKEHWAGIEIYQPGKQSQRFELAPSSYSLRFSVEKAFWRVLVQG